MTAPLIKAMVLAQPDVPVAEGSPIFAMVGVACIIVAVYLAYHLLKRRGGLREQSKKLEKRAKELKKLIKRTQFDFYKRRIEEDKADKLIREYEEELKSATEQIKDMKEKYGAVQTSRWAYLKPRNIAQVTAIVLLIALGLFLMSLAGPGSGGGIDYPGADFEDCSEVPDPEGRSDCYRKEAGAMSEENPLEAIRLCNMSEVPDIRDECYENIAYDVFGHDPGLGIRICGLIEEQGMREECYRGNLINQRERLNEYPGLALQACSFFPERDRDSCYFEIAKELGESQTDIALEACSGIQNKMTSENCIVENVVYFIKDSTEAAQLCSGMERRMEDCFRNALSEVKDVKEAIGICNHATGRFGEDCVNKLIYEFGFELGLGECQSIESETARQNCMWQLLYSGSLTDCHEVIGICKSMVGKEKSRCYEDEYLNKGGGIFIKGCPEESVDVCEEAFEGYRIVECYWNVAREVANVDPGLAIETCGRITDRQKANECYREVAKEIADDNPSLAKKACDKIGDDWMQEDCKNSI